LTDHDRLNSDIIAALLCQFQVRISDICDNHDIHSTALIDRFERVNARFENLLNVSEEGLIIPHEARLLTRMIAREFDTYALSDTGHSYAT
jgi:oxygen-independent coproporphyrinogen-3 oxidase